MNKQVYGPVLLVCIYNKYGNVITHDYFYHLFCQYGEIVKILIFQKAKVWKTFIEFTDNESAKVAMINMNNHVVFQDGSKMNIFPSKLRHIKFQNANLGGVNYQDLKEEQEQIDDEIDGVRTRRSTFQEYTSSSAQSYCYNSQEYNKSAQNHYSQSFSFPEFTDSQSHHHSTKSFNTYIDEQFKQLARQSQQYREIQQKQQESPNLMCQIRRKSKTIVNPNLQQFVLQNSPSKVLFIRSIPKNYSNKCLYNIFNNFGNVVRVIFLKDKSSGLIEYEKKQNAILAKDQLNYGKPEMKIFYSHYQTLVLRKQLEGQDFQEYKDTRNRVQNTNPPTEVLYLTQAIPAQQKQVRELCQNIGCEVCEMEWKQNNKDGRWMCLIQFSNIDDSLLTVGLLQNHTLKNGKQIKFSFTRSKISTKKYRPVLYQ